MSIEARIADAGGRNTGALIEDNALLVTRYTCPPMVKQTIKVFRQYMTQDGTASGTYAMDVDGASTSIEYYIEADDDNDIYITQVNFLVAYASSANLAEWCDSASALSNGFRFYYEREDDVIDIHDAITSNGDLVRLGATGIESEWEIGDVAAQNDYGILVTVPLQSFMPQYGVKLDAGSVQRLVFEVKDDNTTATTGCQFMNAIAYGLERFE